MMCHLSFTEYFPRNKIALPLSLLLCRRLRERVPLFNSTIGLISSILTAFVSRKKMGKKKAPKSTKSVASNGHDDDSVVTSISSGGVSLRFLLVFMAAPYLIGVYFSFNNEATVQEVLKKYLPWIRSENNADDSREQRQLLNVNDCYEKVQAKMFRGVNVAQRDDPFEGLDVVLHRNGETTPCGDMTDILKNIKDILGLMDECPAELLNQKYHAESFMTRLFHHALAFTCVSTEKGRSPDLGFYGFCDMGPDKTPILLDHDLLVPISQQSRGQNAIFLPCHFHNYNGVRVISLAQFTGMALSARAEVEEPTCTSSTPDDASTCSADETQPRQLHLYAVPAGRMFMFAPQYVGEVIPLPHVRGGDPNLPVYLTVLSTTPRVFDLANFFTRTESSELVERALQETRDSHRIKQSSTGATGYNLNRHRTSESGFDTSGATAVAIKQRCFGVLGFDEYIESHADGLQILRYNLTTAYNSHMDWIDPSDTLEHDFASQWQGGNRFATILLYMTDMGERDGGETVFTEGWPSDQAEQDHVELDEAIRRLRESGDGHMLKPNSWEERLVAKCRSRLSIRPSSGRAVLFYSQHPNGTPDRSSLHGGCPVLSGSKMAANLWTWSTVRVLWLALYRVCARVP